jgi:23S rRNA (adenine2503-C2)-methyltransferase
MQPKKINLRGLSLDELNDFIIDLKEKKFKARQLFKWIYQKGLSDFEQMTDLSEELRGKLKQVAFINEIRKIKSIKSEDQSTEKFLFELEDEEKIESVLIRERNRITICVSTQAGCPLGCTFCATGKMGFKRNLSGGEIVDQLIQIKEYLKAKGKITHIVIMGMGEPLLNYENTLKAIKIMHSELGSGFAARKITLSTSGIVPKIYQLAEEELKIKLAISLNAPNDKIRNALMPINKTYPIKELLKAAKFYAQKTGQRMTFEYVLIADINDSKKDALELAKLVQGIPCKINLIAYNSVPQLPFEKPDKEKVMEFRDILYPRCPAVTIRKSKGQEIQAACGQLRAKM